MSSGRWFRVAEHFRPWVADSSFVFGSSDCFFPWASRPGLLCGVVKSWLYTGLLNDGLLPLPFMIPGLEGVGIFLAFNSAGRQNELAYIHRYSVEIGRAHV